MLKKHVFMAGLIILTLSFTLLNVPLNGQQRTCTVTVTAEKEKGDVLVGVEILRKVVKELVGRNKETWSSVYSTSISYRKPVVSFKVAPGIYKVGIRCTAKIFSEEFLLKGNDSHSLRFEIGTIQVFAPQHDRYLQGAPQLKKKIVRDEAGLEKVIWEHLDIESLKNGTTSWDVVPGTYRLDFMEKKIVIPVKGKGTHTFRYEAGTLHISGSRHDDSKGRVCHLTLYRKAEESYIERRNAIKKGDWVRRWSGGLSRNKLSLGVPTGEYKVEIKCGSEVNDSRVFTIAANEVKDIKFNPK
jgi:hypothetical protein